MGAQATPSGHHGETLGGALERIRARHFVGREREKSAFRRFIAPETSSRLLIVSGAGGVGKTTLLGEFRRIAVREDVRVVWLDARRLQPSPPAIAQAVRHGLESVSPQILMIDTVEALAVLEDWLREEYLPTLSAELRVVLAGRWRPSAHWRVDAGWSELLEVCPLTAWGAEETRSYLSRRDVPAEHHDPIHAFASGNPLAVALAADHVARNPGSVFDPAQSATLAESLVDQFMRDLDSWQILVLQAAAVARYTTEPLLAAMLVEEQASKSFDWLREQLFMERSRHGLFPHDLVREAVMNDLVARDYGRYQQLAYRASVYALHYITHDPQRHDAVLDFTFALREEPLVKQMFTLHEAYNYYLDRAQADDWPDIEAMVRHHEGAESVRLLEHWIDRQPEGLWVVRDPRRRVAGFSQLVTLTPEGLAKDSPDPVARGFCAHLEHHGPLRAGEHAALFRFWMDRDKYQNPSAVQSQVFAFISYLNLTNPGLAYTASVHQVGPGAEFFESTVAQGGHQRISDNGWRVGDRTYVAWGHDWRLKPAVQTFLDFIDHIQTSARERVPESSGRILNEAEFARAVRAALRHCYRPVQFRDNPLLHSRVVREAGLDDKSGDLGTGLRALLMETARELPESPRKVSAFRILDRSYFHPAAKQRAVAEALNLSFGTYRRRLRESEQLLIERLWQMELGKRSSSRNGQD